MVFMPPAWYVQHAARIDGTLPRSNRGPAVILAGPRGAAYNWRFRLTPLIFSLLGT
ncbi:hypothetical protein SBV1_370078 [Verrucomicrobia bacterium]|nr:hypothetical protein SBV1_370078 [Verrucomicrobiota bacterium]